MLHFSSLLLMMTPFPAQMVLILESRTSGVCIWFASERQNDFPLDHQKCK